MNLLTFSRCVLVAGVMATAAVHAAAIDIVREINDRNLVTHQYDRMLDQFFTRGVRSKLLNGHFSAGSSEYDPKAIQIYVLEADRRNDIDRIESLAQPYPLALRNAFAVAPNVIVIGEELLAGVTLSIFNDISYMAQGTLNEDPLMGQNAAAALSHFLRFGNIENQSTYELPDKLPATVVGNRAQSDVWLKIADKLFNGLLFLFAHEVAHLQDRQDGAVFDTWASVNAWFSEQPRSSEQRADDEARAAVLQAIGHDRSIVGVGPVFSIASYFRDSINQEIFNGLRGLTPNEMFFTLFHKRCHRADHWIHGRRTDNAQFVMGGYWGVLPMLDKAEYVRLGDRFRQNAALATHEHNFIRAERIFDDMRSIGMSSAEHPIAPFVRFYKAVLQSKPYLLADHIRGRTSITEASFMKAIESWADLRPSPSCGAGLTCKTGRYLEEGFVDVMLQDGYVKYANLAFPVSALDSTDPAIVATYALHHTLRKKSVMSDSEEGIKELAEALMNYSNCGFYSNLYEQESERVEISTPRVGAWMRYRVYPKTHDFLELR